ncbi:methyltransferase [Thioalkalicoccus limnaeus]|uniref:Methyltransferase n=1 Tax=Thioalkalicoccus limnaeus TaxID=120681 RepID=A0ABV4BJJ9_9GAMM
MQARLTLRDRALGVRDRLIASPRFQRWVAGVPIVRKVAQRRARAVFDLVAGFVYSQILFACVRLKLFDALVEGPRSIVDLAERLSLSVDAAERLLRAAAALGLAQRRANGDYGLGELGAAVVGNPGIAAMVEHHAILYADLHDPVALLRGEEKDTLMANYWPYAAGGRTDELAAERLVEYSALMSASQPLIASDVIDAYPFERHRCLLDVAGGEGTFLAAVGARVPALRLMLFDLPVVADRARARFAQVGLADRAEAVGGDMLADPLPEGADLVSLVRVVHDHDDVGVEAIFRSVRRMLPDDGALIVAEAMSDTPGAEPIGDAYFGFYLLAMGRGRSRTPDEIIALLRKAGFTRCEILPTRRPMLVRLVVARP